MCVKLPHGDLNLDPCPLHLKSTYTCRVIIASRCVAVNHMDLNRWFCAYAFKYYQTSEFDRHLPLLEHFIHIEIIRYIWSSRKWYFLLSYEWWIHMNPNTSIISETYLDASGQDDAVIHSLTFITHTFQVSSNGGGFRKFF